MRRQAIAPVIRAMFVEKSVIAFSIAIPLGTHPVPPAASLGLVASKSMRALLAGGRLPVKAQIVGVKPA